jgi:hypothetical protein
METKRLDASQYENQVFTDEYRSKLVDWGQIDGRKVGEKAQGRKWGGKMYASDKSEWIRQMKVNIPVKRK